MSTQRLGFSSSTELEPSSHTPGSPGTPGRSTHAERVYGWPQDGATAPAGLGPVQLQSRDDATYRDDLFLDLGGAVPAVQRAGDADTALDDAQVHAAAAHGVSGGGGALPHLDAIQRSFGDHDVSGVTAHVGGEARDASSALGAHGYATGDHVAFAESPSLFLAAHEAAHVVQQRAGVHLASAVGQAGDAYEQHADAVASRVVSGESAADLLGPVSRGSGAALQRSVVQRYPGQTPPAPEPEPGLVGKAKATGENAMKMGMAAVPYLEAAMKVISTVSDVWKLFHADTVSGPVAQLAPSISFTNKTELDRILMYRLATEYIAQVMAIGLRHGVHFETWKNGKPPADLWLDAKPAPGPADAAKKSEPDLPPETKPFLDELSTANIANIKKLKEEEFQTVMIRHRYQLEPLRWFWNAADGRGTMDPELFHAIGNRQKTWGMLTWSLIGAHIPAGTEMAGIPATASHFGLTPLFNAVSSLAWFEGGDLRVTTHKGIWDDVVVTLPWTGFNPSANQPTGAYGLHAVYKWDNNETDVYADVTFNAEIRQAYFASLKATGEPESGA
jgi:hypothetical protein